MRKSLPAQYNADKLIRLATYRIIKRLDKELKGQLLNPDEIAKLSKDEK